HIGITGARHEITAEFGVSSTLAEITLYDLCYRSSDSTPVTLSPHCLYAKSSWTDFGLLHLTDLHVARRNDILHQRIRDRGPASAATQFNNFNDNLRDAVKYANHLHRSGELDAILMTRDLVDYVYEVDDVSHNTPDEAGLDRSVSG